MNNTGRPLIYIKYNQNENILKESGTASIYILQQLQNRAYANGEV